MSTEARLQRLGLSHLADDPEGLNRELARLANENDRVRDQIRRDLGAVRASLAEERGAGEPMPDPLPSALRKKAAQLYNFYLDTPLTLRPGSPDQERAFTALANAVASQVRAPCPERTLLLEASARVREVWSAAEQFQGGTLDVLLETADLLAQRTEEEHR